LRTWVHNNHFFTIYIYIYRERERETERERGRKAGFMHVYNVIILNEKRIERRNRN
jgi:hypothetical protein